MINCMFLNRPKHWFLVDKSVGEFESGVHCGWGKRVGPAHLLCVTMAPSYLI